MPTVWQQSSFCGGWEFECDEHGELTGWYRSVYGRLADGRWPEWNERTKQRRDGSCR